MLYNSTRTAGKQVKASEAILRGLSEDGGLFVPESIPALDKSLKELSQMTYQQVAYEVMKLYLTDFTEEELKSCIEKAYDEKVKVIIPTYNAGDDFREILGMLVKQTGLAKTDILVVDSSSSDNTQAIVKDAGVSLIVIPQKEFGHGKTRKFAAEQAGESATAYVVEAVRRRMEQEQMLSASDTPGVVKNLEGDTDPVE